MGGRHEGRLESPRLSESATTTVFHARPVSADETFGLTVALWFDLCLIHPIREAAYGEANRTLPLVVGLREVYSSLGPETPVQANVVSVRLLTRTEKMRNRLSCRFLTRGAGFSGVSNPWA